MYFLQLVNVYTSCVSQCTYNLFFKNVKKCFYQIHLFNSYITSVIIQNITIFGLKPTKLGADL